MGEPRRAELPVLLLRMLQDQQSDSRFATGSMESQTQRKSGLAQWGQSGGSTPGAGGVVSVTEISCK